MPLGARSATETRCSSIHPNNAEERELELIVVAAAHVDGSSGLSWLSGCSGSTTTPQPCAPRSTCRIVRCHRSLNLATTGFIG